MEKKSWWNSQTSNPKLWNQFKIYNDIYGDETTMAMNKQHTKNESKIIRFDRKTSKLKIPWAEHVQCHQEFGRLKALAQGIPQLVVQTRIKFPFHPHILAYSHCVLIWRRQSPNCNPGLREKNYIFEIIFKSIKKGWKRWNFSYFLFLLSHRHSLRIIFPIYFSFSSHLLSYSAPRLHSHSTLLQCSKGKPIFFILYFL